jgi:hypothetical protein
VYGINLILSGGGSRVSAGCGGGVGIGDIAYLCCIAFSNLDRIYNDGVARGICVGGGDRRNGCYGNGRGDHIISGGHNVSGGRNISGVHNFGSCIASGSFVVSSVCNFGGRIASGGCVVSGVHDFGGRIASGGRIVSGVCNSSGCIPSGGCIISSVCNSNGHNTGGSDVGAHDGSFAFFCPMFYVNEILVV